MSTRGRRRRQRSTGLGLGGLVLLATLTACSGNGSVETGGRPLAGADDPGDAQYDTMTGTQCNVDVDVSGAAGAKWTGTGSASQGGSGTPSFTYLATRGNSTLTVYAGANGGPATFTFAQGRRTFSAVAGSGGGGIVARSDGTRASVDASGVSVGGTRSVSVQATFTC